jgi:hypothetical protein
MPPALARFSPLPDEGGLGEREAAAVASDAATRAVSLPAQGHDRDGDIPLAELHPFSDWPPSSLFFHRFHLPSLIEVLTWIGQQAQEAAAGGALWSTADMLQLAAPNAERAELLCRSERVLHDVIALVNDFGEVIDWSRMKSAAGLLEALEAIVSSYSRLEELDAAWCAEQLPALERLVTELKASTALQAAHAAREQMRRAEDEKNRRTQVTSPAFRLKSGMRPPHDLLQRRLESSSSSSEPPRKIARADGSASTLSAALISDRLCLRVVSASFEPLVSARQRMRRALLLYFQQV